MAEESAAFPWPGGRRAAVSLTFDDARPSQLEKGLPILDAHGARATFYVSLPNLEARAPDWAQALARGHEIGNHTLTHPCSGNFVWSRANALEDCTLERIESEIVQASARIEALLGEAPRTFAYPCGQKFVGRGAGARSYVPIVARRFLAGRGFRDEAANAPAFCDMAQLMAVDGDGMTAGEIRAWAERAAREGAWLVFAAHDVGDTGPQTMRREALEAVCRDAQDLASGLWLAPVRAVAEWIEQVRPPLAPNT